jgi:hypothetical protein
MKKKSALIFGLVLLTLLSFGSGVVLSQSSKELPRVETACETKAGLIHGFDDGFSILKKCPKGSRQILLGEKPVSGDSSSIFGKILFIDGAYALLNDGTVWNYGFGDDGEESVWRRVDALTVSGVNPSDIVQWGYSGFLTKTGDVYLKYKNSWAKADMSALGK